MSPSPLYPDAVPPDAHPWQDIPGRVNLLERTIERIDGAVERIAESMEMLVRLEERQSETRADVAKISDDHREINKRLSSIENVMPGLVELRKWVIGGILGGLSLMGMALLSLVIHLPK